MRGKLVVIAVLLAPITLAQSAWSIDADIRSLAFRITPVHVNQPVAEPTVVLNDRDHVFFCGPLGFPGGGSLFVRSSNWFTFRPTTINDRAGGGDCHLAVGPDQAIYHSNLQVAASAIRKSTDGGVTFGEAVEDPVEQDRQWLVVDPTDPNVVYQGYHDWSISAIIVGKSTDGGASWLIHSLASSDPTLLADGARASTPGPIRVDPTNHNRVYMVWNVSSVGECVRSPADCARRAHHQVVVGRSDDGGLTWVNRVAMTSPPGSVLGRLIPWISLDAAGNVYVGAAGHIVDGSGTLVNGMYVASSTDRAETWSPPVKVNQGTGAVVFPTVAAGMDGVLNVSWVESTASSPDDTTGVWSVHFAQTRNAHAAAPAFTEVTGPIVHRGDVCTRGLLCTLGGNRQLLDFMDMAIDSFGYAHMAVASTEPTQQIVGLHLLYWRQDAGPSALSEPCPVPGGADCVTTRPQPRP